MVSYATCPDHSAGTSFRPGISACTSGEGEDRDRQRWLYVRTDSCGHLLRIQLLGLVFALQCSHAGPPPAKAENPPFGVVDDKEAEEKRAAIVASIDHQLERINTFKHYALECEELTGDAAARAFSLPAADATDKLLRYEGHLDRQLYRAMDQLDRLQRQRRGENVPPPLNINLGKRS